MKKFSSLLLILLLSITGFSQILEPVAWSFSKKDLGNKEYELIFTATIDNHWHLYSQKIEMQPPATLFVFEENSSVKFIGKVVETESVEKYDPNFDMMIRYFSDKAVFTQRVKILEGESTIIKGTFEFMSCDDTRCLPPTELDFTFKIGEVKKTELATTKVDDITTKDY